MAKRSMWKGFVSIAGLFNVPVKLITMREDKGLHPHMYRASDMSRIKMPKTAEKDGKPVMDAEIVYGFDVAGGKEIVVLSKDERNAAKVESNHKIRIEKFVPVGNVDQMFFDSAYIILPDGMEDAYALLLQAFSVRGMAGIGKITLRDKEYVAIIHAYNGGMVLSTLKYSDEIITPATIGELQKLPAVDGNALNMAISIIDAMAGTFDLTQYHDEAREKLLSVIDAKRRGEVITAPKAEVVAQPGDLMNALKAALAVVEDQKAATPAPKLEVAPRGV